MTLVTSSIPNLINGVSQQPYILRDPSQAETQVNALSSVVEGLRKRPPSAFEFVAAEDGTELAKNPRTLVSHVINRDDSEQYQVLFSGTDIRVFDINTRDQVNVAFSDKTRDYLSCVNPRRDLRAMTVGDYTFILNRTKKATMLPDKVDKYRPDALIWVKLGAYGSDYTVTIDNVTTTFKTPSRAATETEWDNGARYLNNDNVVMPTDGGTSSAPFRELPKSLTADYIGTDTIGKALYNLLRTNTSLTDKFTFQRFGSLIRVRPIGTLVNEVRVYDDFSISATDSQGDTILRTYKDSIQTFAELPKVCFSDFRLKVMGDGATKFDDYYVRYEGYTTGGTWVEDIAANQVYKIDVTSMPHALVRLADGTFELQTLDWASREAGDATSNPVPSIMGKRIRDIFFFRGRFGMVSQEQVVMSRYGDYYNLFKASATQTLDTDPIDVTVSHAKSSDINHAVTYNETLILWGQNVQFQIADTDLLTPTTVSFNQTTEFPCSANCRPAGAGSYIYFAYDRGTKAAMKEYFVDSATTTKDGTDVTSHVPTYIPSGVDEIIPCPAENLLIALTEGDLNSMYVYNYFWEGETKIQSAWSRWDFEDDAVILSAAFMDSTLWVTFLRHGVITMESMDLSPNPRSSGVDFLVHLDRRITEAQVTLSYNETRDETTIQLPFKPTSSFQLVAKKGNPESVFQTGRRLFQGYTEGELVSFKISGMKLIVPYRLERFWFGLPYEFRYKFSPLTFRKQSAAGDLVAVVDGRLQLRRMSLSYVNSGYFKVSVKPDRRNEAEYFMTAKTIGEFGTVLGETTIDSGAFNFQIMSQNTGVSIIIINDSYLPSTFISADWQGIYATKGVRV